MKRELINISLAVSAAVLYILYKKRNRKSFSSQPDSGNSEVSFILTNNLSSVDFVSNSGIIFIYYLSNLARCLPTGLCINETVYFICNIKDMGDHHTGSGNRNYPAGEIKRLYKIIVAGGRDFNTEEDYLLMEKKLGILLSVLVTKPDIKIVFIVGKAKGADLLGERYARTKGYEVEPYPVTNEDWAKHGKYAGHLRNQKMLDANANALVAFHDGESRGTANMIDIATKKGITVKVIKYAVRPKLIKK